MFNKPTTAFHILHLIHQSPSPGPFARRSEFLSVQITGTMSLSVFRFTAASSRLARAIDPSFLRHFATPSASTSTIPPKNPQPPSTPHSSPRDELTLLYDAVLLQVPHHGWTSQAIAQAIRNLGWSSASRAMLPRGPVQVVEEFIRRCDISFARQLARDDHPPTQAPSIDRAEFAIRTRLEMVEPFHAQWPPALKLRALPRNSRRALRDSALLADEIAHYAGFTRPDVCCTPFCPVTAAGPESNTSVLTDVISCLTVLILLAGVLVHRSSRAGACVSCCRALLAY